MIFGNPVRGKIYLTSGTVDGHARWFRSQRFGCTGFGAEPALGTCAHFHRGVDIARGPAGCGDDLLNVSAGTVIYAGLLTSGAKSVVVRHSGGYASGHSHMSSVSVRRGQAVAKGQKLGTVGQTGNATGCHDHLAIKTGFPSGGDVNDFWRDGVGHFVDAWPLLEQNVQVRVDPTAPDGTNIRSSATLDAASRYASVQGDRLVAVNGTDLGAKAAWRAWGGTVDGATYSVGGVTGNRWQRIYLAGGYRYIAAPLADLSA